MKLLRNYEVMNIDPDKQLASDPNQKVEKITFKEYLKLFKLQL